MTQLLDGMDNQGKFNAIVNRASFIGGGKPAISWTWHQIAKLIKLTPIAYQQVLHGDRPISSLILPFGLILFLVFANMLYMWHINKWIKDFRALYKEEVINLKNYPIKTLIKFIKMTIAVVLFGGSAFLVSQFFIFR
jgi:hypothetical protein